MGTKNMSYSFFRPALFVTFAVLSKEVFASSIDGTDLSPLLRVPDGSNYKRVEISSMRQGTDDRDIQMFTFTTDGLAAESIEQEETESNEEDIPEVEQNFEEDMSDPMASIEPRETSSQEEANTNALVQTLELAREQSENQILENAQILANTITQSEREAAAQALQNSQDLSDTIAKAKDEANKQALENSKDLSETASQAEKEFQAQALKNAKDLADTISQAEKETQQQAVKNAKDFPSTLLSQVGEERDTQTLKNLTEAEVGAEDPPMDKSQAVVNDEAPVATQPSFGNGTNHSPLDEITTQASTHLELGGPFVVTFSLFIANPICAASAIALSPADIKNIKRAICDSLADSKKCSVTGEFSTVSGRAFFYTAQAAAVGQAFLAGLGVGAKIGEGTISSPLSPGGFKTSVETNGSISAASGSASGAALSDSNSTRFLRQL